MYFARIVALTVISVTLVNASSFDEERQQVNDARREMNKFVHKLTQLPGIHEVSQTFCSSERQCREWATKAMSTLFKRGYEPWGIAKIDPLKIKDFELKDGSKFENVQITGFDRLDLFNLTKLCVKTATGPKTDKYNFDLTVKGTLRRSLTVKDKQYETDFVTKYDDVKAVVKSSCAEGSWRLRDCDRKYDIDYKSDGKAVTTLSGMKDTVPYQEWASQNEKTIEALQDEVLKKSVKAFVDAIKSVTFKLEERFETSVDGDKMDKLWEIVKKYQVTIGYDYYNYLLHQFQFLRPQF